jgi:hypothetical protein
LPLLQELAQYPIQNSVNTEGEQMTDDEMPSAEEQRRLLATMPGDTGTALRLAAAFADGDSRGAAATIDEIAANGRSLWVLAAMATLTSRLAYGLTAWLGEEPQTWLNAAALGMVDDVHRRLKDGDTAQGWGH